MAGLVLKLGAREKLLINGAVVENGDRRSCISVLTPNVKLLRLRDAIHPEEASTPVRQTAYLAQLAITGDAEEEEVKPRILKSIKQLETVFEDHDSREILTSAAEAAANGRFYSCLKRLKPLISREDRLLATRRP